MSRLRARIDNLEREALALAASVDEGSALARYSSYYGRELDFIAEQLLSADGKPKRYWAGQRAIVESLMRHRRVTVRSCRKGSKTETSADLILAFAQTGPTIVVSTAAGGRQVETGLWSRVNAQFIRSRQPMIGECLNTKLNVAPDWYALGFSTNDSTRFQGFHAGVEVPDDPDAPDTREQVADAIERAAHEVKKRSSVKRLLVLFDEAAGIDQMIFDAAKGSLIGDNTYALMGGNPTREADDPHEFCRSHRPDSGWHRIKISSREADDPIDCDESFVVPWWLVPAGELDKLYPPGTPEHRPHVLGQFYDGDDMGGRVITFAMLRASQDPSDRCLKRGAHIGFDTAWKGGDLNVAALYVDSVKVSEDAWHSQDTLATWERMKRLRAHWQEQIGQAIPWSNVHIDDAPVAAGIIDTASREGCSLHRVSFAEAPNYAWRHLTGEVRFKNKRAEMYWTLRELLRQGLACIPRKWERSWQELTAHSYTRTAGSDELLIEPKDRVRERLGRSPDHADADVLAFAETPQLYFKVAGGRRL